MADVEKHNDDKRQIFLQFENRDLPAFVEVKGKNYIYYGERNDYPYYLIDLYTQSPLHKGIVDGKVNYICGNGWSIDSRGMSEGEKAKANALVKNPFGIEDLQEATYRWCQDLELFNGMCALIYWDNKKDSGTFQYIDMSNVRTNADMTEFYYTTKWFTLNKDGSRKLNPKPELEKDWKVYPAYDVKNKSGTQLYYWKFPHPNQRVYALPVYQGATTWIDVNVELGKYFYHTVANAFVPTHLLNFYNGEPSPEKADAIEQRIKEKWTKPTGSRIIVNFAPNKDTAADIQTLQMTDADKQYDAVWKFSEQSIISGHEVTSGMLFGIYREGTLGGRSELAFAEEHFQNSYISGRQNIIERFVNKIAEGFGIKATFKLNKVRRVGYSFGDDVIRTALKTDEIRTLVLEQLGIKPLELQQTTARFVEQDPYEKIARSYPNHELIFEECVEDFDREAMDKAEFLLKAFAFEEDMNANTLERIILDLLSKDPTTQPEVIAKTANSTVDKVNKTIKSLIDREILSPFDIGEGGTGHEVTKKGETVKDENKPAKTAKMEVVYRYGLAPNFKGEDEIIPSTRDWCRKMVNRSHNGDRWKSEDLWAMKNDMPSKYGQNAWRNRGGWYTQPDGTHVPQCRHAWYRQLIKVEQ
jgi:hypothetical protein